MKWQCVKITVGTKAIATTDHLQYHWMLLACQFLVVSNDFETQHSFKYHFPEKTQVYLLGILMVRFARMKFLFFVLCLLPCYVRIGELGRGGQARCC